MGTAADGNLNGIVDIDDHRVWKTNFGSTYDLGVGNTVGSAGTVPEADGRRMIILAIVSVTAVFRTSRLTL
jgi:hypothetical protein